MGRRKKNKWQSAQMNDDQYNHYYELLEQLACSIYRWEGLPPEIDQRFLELVLFNRGMVAFFWDDEYEKYFATTASPSGAINMYNNPTKFLCYGADGFRREKTMDDCVPVWNNYLRRPDTNTMRIYARRLADIDRTIDVNLLSQKMPVFLTVPEQQRLTAQNLMKQWSGNEPIIIGADGVFDTSQMDYLSSGAPFIVNDLLKAKQTIWSEIMTFLGIDNLNIDKAERVQATEVRANNGQIEASRLIRLNCRRMACEQINDMFGLNVWVDMNRDIESDNFNFIGSLQDQAQLLGGGGMGGNQDPMNTGGIDE